MFTNFELSKAGLIKVSPKPKKQRTTTGCFECLLKKKKCDERLPKCSRCVKYETSCIWRGGPASMTSSQFALRSGFLTPSPSHRETSSPTSVLKNNETLPPHSSPSGSQLTSRGISNRPISSAQNEISLHTEQAAIWESIARSARPAIPLKSLLSMAFNQPDELRGLQFLCLRFRSITNPSYIKAKFSTLAHVLPTATEHPVIKNAILACGFAQLAKSTLRPEDERLAKKYYCNAINKLAVNLSQSEDEEVNLGSVLLLHKYEKISCDSLYSKRLHLLGAHSILGSSKGTRVPSNPNHIRIIEAYVYHLSISSTFSGILSAPFPNDHVSKLLDTIYKAPIASDPQFSWRQISLLGVSHTLFDIVFRTSQLRRRLPLGNFARIEAHKLKKSLQNWRWEEGFPFADREQPPGGMLLTAQLYRCACLLLIEKVIETSLLARHQIVRTIVEDSRRIISQIPTEDLQHSIHLWPLLILGFAAISPRERALFLTPFQGASISGGFNNVLQAHKLLKKSWSCDETSREPLGLDVLLRNDLLCQVFM